MLNPYEVLGLTRDASDEEIKKSYRVKPQISSRRKCEQS